METPGQFIRARRRIAAAIVLTITLGVASRTVGQNLPAVVSKDAGDVLWGTMFYLIVICVRPRISPGAAVLVAFILAAGTEFLKLYHAPWIDAVRDQRLAGFLMGRVFGWGNFVGYFVGVLAGVMVDSGLIRRRGSGQAFEESLSS
jgi:hypothetical protein